jgi:predicted metal-dependent phosphoesterase TrpH
MKIDLHTHSYPGSLCAEHYADELPEIYAKAGMDALVLTNYCFPYHCEDLGEELHTQAKNFVKIYEHCMLAGKRVGVRVFFGVEVKLIKERKQPEFLLYGIGEQDFINSFPLYEYTQKELFEYCERENILMIQAHPFKTSEGNTFADLEYLHGFEVFNPYIKRKEPFEDLVGLAERTGKIMTAGSDFRHRMQVGNAGMIIPDEIYDQYMLRDYLRSERPVIFDKDGIIYGKK